MDIFNELSSTVGGYSSNGAVLAIQILVDCFGYLFGFLGIEF
jgi:hypothetical protein